MKAYKTSVTIENPQQVILSGLPFEAGDRVEVIILSAETETSDRITPMKKPTVTPPSGKFDGAPPMTEEERRQLADKIGSIPGKPLSEIIIEGRGPWETIS